MSTHLTESFGDAAEFPTTAWYGSPGFRQALGMLQILKRQSF